MMSGHGTIETAVEATKIGAFDFLEKPIGLQKLLVDDRARAQERRGAGAAARLALGARQQRRDARDRARARAAARGAPPGADPRRARHRTRRRGARARSTPDAPCVALANGSRLTANPLALLEEAREGTLYCAEIGQYSKVEQKGLAFLLPKLEKHERDAGVHEHASRSAIWPPRASSTRRCCRSCRSGAVMLPPLRTRREDIPPLIERFWREATRGRSAGAAARRAAARRAHRAHQRVLAGQSRSSRERRREPGAACAARSPPST